MRKALGKGIEALIPKVSRAAPMEIVSIDINKIKPNKYQSRMQFDQEKLKELANSIKGKGVVQPIIVSPSGENYQLVAGERRWWAAKMAELKEIPAVVRRVTDREMFEISLIENIQREDLNPIEEATAFERLMKEFNLTQQELADHLGKTRSTVANILRLINLPEEIKEFVSRKLISAGHARVLLSIAGEEKRIDLARKILKEKLTVRETEDIVERLRVKRTPSGKRVARKEKSPEVVELEEELQRILGTKVRIKSTGSGRFSLGEGGKVRGKIEIEYYSLEDLERIVELLKS
ncbi:Stage 0 sporulation protein J [subsurface metagenome]|nr:ParB/RepB/Spo0J family partition protein [Bacillota bacterium]